MKVFISWSGPKSKALAKVLSQWLPSVLQAVQPYYSPEDIGKGSRWSTEIAHELEQSRVGLICVTSDNLSAPWVMFEAGSLAKDLGKSRVCPILFDVATTDLQGPLVQFQAAKFEKLDMKRVIVTINEELGDSALDRPVLDKVFDKWWPELQSDVSAALEESRAFDSDEIRSERDLLKEVLQLLRFLAQESQERIHTESVYPSDYIQLARAFRNVAASIPYSLVKTRAILEEFVDRLEYLLTAAGAPEKSLHYVKQSRDLIRTKMRHEEHDEQS